MEKSFSESYKAAGVDVTAGYRAVELMKGHVARTMTPGVVSDIGGFGGLFMPDLTGMKQPVLVSGTDGVGTKIKLAFYSNRHNTIGIDCVAMVANDVICCGAKPIFFLDYLAVGKNYPEKVAEIVSGLAEGCVQAGCALIGGETAEHPGLMPEDEYDLGGFCVGIVDKEKILQNSSVETGDIIVSLASSGVHSNGFSLVRKIFPLTDEVMYDTSALGIPLIDALLAPTTIYVKPVLEMIEAGGIKAIANITGGGFYENIPRALPDDKTAVIEKAAVKVPPLFQYMQQVGNIPERDMFNTFNMGTGMTAIVKPDAVDNTIAILAKHGVPACVIGEVKNGEKGVEFK
ncbi:MAG: phosphoribosylformylglycinamidine cyclo-ligase [Ruminococcaceae bacterium]|nr:phosphoribosylformylglycinamidine cyclo-ligase [Oscillospiraceae bacterium]